LRCKSVAMYIVDVCINEKPRYGSGYFAPALQSTLVVSAISLI
jgi:hypothetical protein